MDERLIESVLQATAFLKALANGNRLLVLCHLTEGEKSVTELEQLIGIRQPTLSQQLARLRSENLVKTRREAKTVYYSLAGGEVTQVIGLLHELFCEREPSTVIRSLRTPDSAA